MTEENRISDENLENISGGGPILDAGVKLLNNKGVRRALNIKSAIISEHFEKKSEKKKAAKD